MVATEMRLPARLAWAVGDPDALLVLAASSSDPDLAPFVGSVKIGRALLVATRDGVTLGYFSPLERGEAARSGCSLLTPEALDIPRLAREKLSEAELLERVTLRALPACGLGSGLLGVTGSLGAGTVYQALRALETQGYRFVDGRPLVRRMRKRKTAKELEEIARVAAGTCAAMRAVASLLAQASVRGGELWCEGERLTIGRLRRRIAEVLGTFALEQPERNIVAPAEEGAVPHNPGSDDRTVREGQSLVVDLFPRGRLFADCTRTFCVGEPPENLRRAHAEVVQALRWAHREARPGRRTWELQQGVCASFREAGYPTPLSDPGTVRGYVHSLGHGVGYELHEWPFFRDVPGIEGELELGDVVTLEPGLYDEEQGWAVRLEDLVVLDVDGPRNLTPLPYDLDPRGW